jgi:hypothetical protein
MRKIINARGKYDRKGQRFLPQEEGSHYRREWAQYQAARTGSYQTYMKLAWKPLWQIKIDKTTIYHIRISMQISAKGIQDFTSRWVTGWISKSWALECQLFPTAKRADPLESKLFVTVTRLESGLVEFNYSLDQCLQVRHQFRLLPLIINMRWKKVSVRPLGFSMSIDEEPLLGVAFLTALECGL